jgi:hypothetical protein
MPNLELTAPEAELLRELAEDWLSDLRTEISKTDQHEYREALKWKESLLRDVMRRLGNAPP